MSNFAFGLLMGGVGMSRPIDYLHHLGIPESNAGANFSGGHFWLPSGDSASAPKWVSLAEWFAQFSRGSSKWVFDQTGNLVEVPSGAPAFNWRGGKRGLWNEGPSTRITPYPAHPFTNWQVVEATKIAQVGTYLNVFNNACVVTSQGESSQHVRSLSIYNLVANTPVAFTVAYIGGTSGRVRIVFRAASVRPDAALSGVVGQLPTFTTGPTGILAVTQQWQAPDGTYICSGTWTPSSDANQVAIGVGPDSSVSGENVILVGGWLETSPYPTSPILGNPSGQATRAADYCRLPAAMEAVLQRPAASVLVAGRDALNLANGRLIGVATRRVLGSNTGGDVIALGNESTIELGSGLSAPLPSFSISAGWSASGKSGSFNGNSVVTSAVSMDADLTTIFLGRTGNGGFINAQNDIIAAFPDHLSNTRMEQIAARWAA